MSILGHKRTKDSAKVNNPIKGVKDMTYKTIDTIDPTTAFDISEAIKKLKMVLIFVAE